MYECLNRSGRKFTTKRVPTKKEKGSFDEIITWKKSKKEINKSGMEVPTKKSQTSQKKLLVWHGRTSMNI
jgi:hypothetical protein